MDEDIPNLIAHVVGTCRWDRSSLTRGVWGAGVATPTLVTPALGSEGGKRPGVSCCIVVRRRVADAIGQADHGQLRCYVCNEHGLAWLTAVVDSGG